MTTDGYFVHRLSLFLVFLGLSIHPSEGLAHSASRVEGLAVLLVMFGALLLVCFILALFSFILLRRSVRGVASPWLKRFGMIDGVVSLQILGIWLFVGGNVEGSQLVLLCASIAMATLSGVCFKFAHRYAENQSPNG